MLRGSRIYECSLDSHMDASSRQWHSSSNSKHSSSTSVLSPVTSTYTSLAKRRATEIAIGPRQAAAVLSINTSANADVYPHASADKNLIVDISRQKIDCEAFVLPNCSPVPPSLVSYVRQ